MSSADPRTGPSQSPPGDTSLPPDARLVSATRLILASSALLVIYIDPAEPDRFVALTYIALVLYTLYSAALYLLPLRRTPLRMALYEWAPWVDVCWYTVFVALSNGTNSVFFFFYFFSILVASFRWGFASGLGLTIVSVASFIVMGLVTGVTHDFQLNRFLLRPTYLLVLGYMMAHWGGAELTLRNRLSLLKTISTLSNPRFGVDHTVGSILERLRAFYDADSCALLMLDPEVDEFTLHRATRDATKHERITTDLARRLLALPENHTAIFDSRAREWWRGGGASYAVDAVGGARSPESRAAIEALAATLDAASLVTVPVRIYNRTVGRLFLASSGRRAFGDADAEFLLHTMEHVTPTIENIRLVNRLASDAAAQERHRIARTIHDGVIQPYIGLKMGLEVVRARLSGGGAGAEEALDRVVEMTDLGIAGLRRYVSGLKETGEPEDVLVPAVRRFAARFSEATGIAVDVDAEAGVHASDQLAAEAFYIVAEGLSNVRRHARATSATVAIACHDGRLLICLENNSEHGTPAPFNPRSISERARALGGEARVECKDGVTRVAVDIPL